MPPPNPAPKPKLPGTDLIASWIQLHTGVVQRHLDTLNEVWMDVTSEDASLNSWTRGYGKLVSAWAENAKVLRSHYLGKTLAGPGLMEGVPLVGLVVDAATEGTSQSFSVSATLDRARVRWTPLRSVSSGAALVDEAGVPPDFDTIVANGVATVSLAGMQRLQATAPRGAYWSTIYEEMGALSPAGAPPRRVLALVILTIV